MGEIKNHIFFRENGTGIIGSLGRTHLQGCNQDSLYFSCSPCSGGKHFSLKTKLKKDFLVTVNIL